MYMYIYIHTCTYMMNGYISYSSERHKDPRQKPNSISKVPNSVGPSACISQRHYGTSAIGLSMLNIIFMGFP